MPSPSSLKHIVGIVTGGASGLGAATCATLLKAGARVVIADLPHQHERYLQLAEQVCRDFEASSDTMTSQTIMTFVETDVTQEDQVNRALDVAEELYGEPGEYRRKCSRYDWHHCII
jgi:NAD(P)-dependent dehydrogenase (short-subunit alcohol dehydrogenase family)